MIITYPTASYPYDSGYFTTRDEFAFLERAWNALVEIACPGLEPILDGDEISLALGWLKDGEEVGGLQVEVFTRSSAIRLLQAGYLDQSGDELIMLFPDLEGATHQ